MSLAEPKVGEVFIGVFSNTKRTITAVGNKNVLFTAEESPDCEFIATRDSIKTGWKEAPKEWYVNVYGGDMPGCFYSNLSDAHLWRGRGGKTYKCVFVEEV